MKIQLLGATNHAIRVQYLVSVSWQVCMEHIQKYTVYTALSLTQQTLIPEIHYTCMYRKMLVPSIHAIVRALKETRKVTDSLLKTNNR